ncbi:unnamed protein product [Orchesella dallaii]|uniref:Uncharacterized protein n=1 Tax=Orchesella dallaii TaxID=48710 RepID=A0ABP1R1A8_9HEXA
MWKRNGYLILLFVCISVLSCLVDCLDYDREVEERGCAKYTTSSTLYKRNVHYNTLEKGWVVLLSSKHIAYHLGMQIHGNSSLPEEKLQQLCIRVDRDGIISYHNNNKKVLFNCTYSGFEDIYCYPTDRRAHHHVAGPLKITFVWNDETTDNLIMVLCASRSNEKYWMMGSSTETLNSGVESDVLGFVGNLGFDSSKVLYHSRSTCHEGGLGKHGWFGNWWK